MKKLLLLSTILIGSLTTSARAEEVITVKGSDTMVILNQRWAENFMAKNPDVTVQVTGGGSGTGLSALINGTTDIAAASRPIKPAEQEKVRDRYNTTGVDIPVAKDGVAIYVNDVNPVKNLTIEQLKGIYTGKITNWKEVGGNDAKIMLYGRENNSGTYVFVKDNVLEGKDFTPRTQTLPGTGAVVNAVSKDKNAIGYGGAAYAKNVRDLGVSHEGKAPVLPTAKTIADGSYPLARDLHFYLRSAPTGVQKKFVDWTLSPEGQAVVVKVGYFPIK